MRSPHCAPIRLESHSNDVTVAPPVVASRRKRRSANRALIITPLMALSFLGKDLPKFYIYLLPTNLLEEPPNCAACHTGWSMSVIIIFKMSFVESLPQEDIIRFCRRWSVRELALFGSVLRTDFKPESDVDVLVSFHRNMHWGLFDHVQMQL